MVKPKVSTGYLTPQAKKNKTTSIKNPKTSSQDAEMNEGINEELFQALMNDPRKKNAILRLLKENKKAIDDYRKKEESAKVASPTCKVKNKEKHMESPTALMRRRAMEKMHGSPCSCAPSDTTSTSQSRCSSPNCSTPVPFKKILDGVVALLEIKNRQGEDKSAGAKSVLTSMGAKIRDTFTSDVTHVIFKDGSLSTYQRAKSKNIHLVSILWVDFCRKSSKKQNERLYPALRSAFDDESMICSQMEKDYEEIIRDEYKKSLTQGTPLPSTRALIDRRRTLMTPSLSNLNTSSAEIRPAESQNSEENTEDMEVAQINGFTMNQNLIETELLVMNDPGNFSQHDMEKNRKSSHVLTSIENVDMELTIIPETQSIIGPEILQASADMELTSICDKTRKTQLYNRRRTICSSFMSSDNSTLSGLDKSKEKSFAVPTGTATRKSKRVSVNMSINEEESFVIGKNSVKAQKSLNGEVDKTASAISVLKISSDDLFSLRLTGDSDKQKPKSASKQLFSDNTESNVGFALHLSSEKPSSMSELQLSSDKSATNKRLNTESNEGFALHLSSEKPSSMSELQLSSDKSATNKGLNTESNEGFALHLSSEKPLSMSELQLSSDKSPANKRLSNKKSADSSKSSLNTEDTVSSLGTTAKISSGRDSASSNDSEVMISVKNIRKNYVSQKEQPETNVETTTTRGRWKHMESRRKTLGSAEISGLAAPPDSPREASVGVGTRRKTLGPRQLKNDLAEAKKSAVRTRRQTLVPPKRVTIAEPTKYQTDKNSTDSSSDARTRSKSKPQTDKNSTDSSDSASDSTTRSKSRKRKLYRPGDELVLMEVDDDKERQQRREELKNRKRKSNEGVLLPLGAIMNKLPVQSTSSESEAAAVTPPKRNKKKPQKKQPEKNESFDSSLDEQKELLEEVLRRKKDAAESAKNPPPSRKTKPNELEPQTPSTRKSTRVTKPPVIIRSPSEKETLATSRNRRSTLDYMSKSQITSHMKKMYKKVEKVGGSTIVCTKCHRPDVQLFAQIVKKLGKFTVEDEVTDRTTHLIAGEAKRTVNMLRGLARGCWILKYEWLIRSLEEGKWLPEEDFEVIDFSPAVQKCRLERQAFGSKYKMDIFESCPPIYVALNSTPRCSDIRELITTCKGKIVRLTKLAQIVVGQYCEGAVCVTESWVLDSITFYRKMPFKDKYLIRSNSR